MDTPAKATVRHVILFAPQIRIAQASIQVNAEQGDRIPTTVNKKAGSLPLPDIPVSSPENSWIRRIDKRIPLD